MQPLIKDGILLDISDQNPSPSKDFVNFIITRDEVIWRVWKISPYCLKPDVKVAPTESKESHSDFLQHSEMQSEVKRLFGENMLIYAKGLCEGHVDYLVRLSDALQIYILSFLDLVDIAHVSQTNKDLHQLCNSEQLWEHIVERHCDTVTPEMKLFAADVGWKHVFFTNKLQLQAQIRRHQQRKQFVKEAY